jgi:hypothetical protein
MIAAVLADTEEAGRQCGGCGGQGLLAGLWVAAARAVQGSRYQILARRAGAGGQAQARPIQSRGHCHQQIQRQPRACTTLSPDPALAKRPILSQAGTAAAGHEDQFLPPKLSARSVIREQTVAATQGNGRDAPIAAICERRIELVGSTPSGRSWLWPPFGHRWMAQSGGSVLNDGSTRVANTCDQPR